MLATSFGRFRIISIIEGISFLTLLFIAMPLKYNFGMPVFVKYNGMAHGVLFVLYVLMLIEVAMKDNWKFSFLFTGFCASLFPFATFVFNRYMIKHVYRKK
ncbi:DUF3817 domain-containing protein [Massilibacterium senegalense]|uniref:DUF3817 domain-containing protein n=1 Tax=Massilibacterium senegalense TaxID=1632858 RepID=UPI0007821408|nr:DUF3817 domain-containing protein [Massilibacterium senegalense]